MVTIPSVRTSSAGPVMSPSVWIAASVAEISKPTLRFPLTYVFATLEKISSLSHAWRTLLSTSSGTGTTPPSTFSVSSALHSASLPVLTYFANASMYSRLFLISLLVGTIMPSLLSIGLPAPVATAAAASLFSLSSFSSSALLSLIASSSSFSSASLASSASLTSSAISAALASIPSKDSAIISSFFMV